MAVVIFASFVPQFARAQVVEGADFERDISFINRFINNKSALCEFKFADNVEACEKAHDDLIASIRILVDVEKKFAFAFNAKDWPTARDERGKVISAKHETRVRLRYLEDHFPSGAPPLAKLD